MTEQRERVEEWRITTRVGPYVVRYWIEADVASPAEARRVVGEAESRCGWKLIGPLHDSVGLARFLLDAIPAANSVEVCTEEGTGIAIHRDWP